MKTSRLILGTAALLVAAACGGSGGDGGGGPNGGSSAMTARIDGNSWSADQVQASAGSAQVPGSLIILGIKALGTSTTSLTLLLGYIGAPGTYPLGVNQLTTPGGAGGLLLTTAVTSQNRTTPFNGTAGTLTVTTLTADRMTGTFQFVAEPILGSPFNGNRTITDGEFAIDLPASFTSVPPANHGSRVQANLGGTPFTGATVVGQGAAGSFTLGGSTDSLTLDLITAAPVTTTGTYPMLTGIKVSVSDLKLNHNWGGVSDDSGSVIVTSVAPGRVIGTFSGRLHALGGATPDLMISDGFFDVRIGN